jgi:type 1 fimbria pilin
MDFAFSGAAKLPQRMQVAPRDLNGFQLIKAEPFNIELKDCAPGLSETGNADCCKNAMAHLFEMTAT